jgi:osmoprotectant transport system permease protein
VSAAPARKLVLAFAVAGALALLAGFLSLAPNRLASGAPFAMYACSPAWAAAIALALALLAFSAFRPRPWLTLAVGGALLIALPLAAGAGAATLLQHAPLAARVELGAGFWLLLGIAILACLDASAALALSSLASLALTAALLAVLALMAWTGRLDALSLAHEFANHRAAFWAACARHLLLVAVTLAGACAAGIPLGLLAWRRPAWRPPLFGVLNVVQTLPSIALFGLLMAPLAKLGLSGIGLVPAAVALVLYALMPTVRAIVTGLDNVPAAPLDAAAGLGFSPLQIFFSTRLPLAAPALLAGLRVVVVQAVGLAVVAALIGAGGFGDFVFQGLGQYALDLVLLGALPATALALLADALLSLAANTAATTAGRNTA